MKHFLLLITFATIFAFSANAQIYVKGEIYKDSSDYLVVSSYMTPTGFVTKIDLPEAILEKALTDSTGKKLKFLTLSQVLQYLDDHGYETFSVTEPSKNYYEIFLRKKHEIKNEETE